MNSLPEGFTVPEGRVKPWGTTHALLACKGIVNEPFAIINADDFYGKNPYNLLNQSIQFRPNANTNVYFLYQ